MSNYLNNGGTSVKLGDYELKVITSYEVKFTPESESFTNWNYETVDIYKGERFSATITTIADSTEKTELISVLNTHAFKLTSPDYTGNVVVSSVTAPIKSSNFAGTYYKITFKLTATTLIGGSGSL